MKAGYCADCGHAKFAHKGAYEQPDRRPAKTSCDLCLCKKYRD